LSEVMIGRRGCNNIAMHQKSRAMAARRSRRSRLAHGSGMTEPEASRAANAIVFDPGFGCGPWGAWGEAGALPAPGDRGLVLTPARPRGMIIN
jgi:hypothetical protein